MLLVLLLACESTTVTTAATCPLGAPTLTPSSAAPGDQVVVTVSPLTEVWDTAITVGATRATVVGLDRSTCTDCDECRDTGGCTECDACNECDTTCATCVETVTFVVPEVAAGTWTVEVINRHGRSERADLVVTDTDSGL